MIAVDPIGQPGLSVPGGRPISSTADLAAWLGQALESLAVNGRAERSRCVVKMGPRGLVASYLYRDQPSHARHADRGTRAAVAGAAGVAAVGPGVAGTGCALREQGQTGNCRLLTG
jgi:hypothetical protein